MRNISKWLAVGALLATGGTALIAADAPATPPAPTTRPMGRTPKVDKPYSELSDLTDDQKAQIIEIEQKANKQLDEIRHQERADIMALLSDDQKKELAADEAKARAEAEAKAAARRKAKMEATTQPAAQ